MSDYKLDERKKIHIQKLKAEFHWIIEHFNIDIIKLIGVEVKLQRGTELKMVSQAPNFIKQSTEVIKHINSALFLGRAEDRCKRFQCYYGINLADGLEKWKSWHNLIEI